MWPAEPRARAAAGGFSLVDVLLVIVLLGIVAVGVLQTASRFSQQAAQAAKTRQMLALAEALLNEVRAMPFTYCEPPLSAGSAAACGAQVDQMGPEPGESRYNAANRFDGVSDYQGFAMPGPGCAGLCDVNGNVLNGPGSPLQGCTAGVTLTPQAFGGIAATDASGRPQALRIRVQVTCTPDTIALEGLRVRHAPNRF